ncbi:uncharacterized protein [Haliotis cracherodii]|uniref:uncharacterized protein n=1 Tax=Haliotis cracherodii TaxID=6455 RepID=UPI0039EA022E
MKAWARAVWMEADEEMEETIPSLWIQEKTVRWPNTSNAMPAMKEMRCPTEKWLTFNLVKVKCSSDSKRECQDFDFTTTVETSSDDEQLGHPSVKRLPKKKVMLDFVTGFQRRVLYLLTEIRDLTKQNKDSAGLADTVSVSCIEQLNTLDELDTLEGRLREDEYVASLMDLTRYSLTALVIDLKQKKGNLSR